MEDNKPPKVRFTRKGYEYVRLPKSSMGGSKGHIIIDPDIQFGEPTIAGTRIPAESIYSFYSAGDKPEHIAQIYGRPLEDMLACIEYVEGK